MDIKKNLAVNLAEYRKANNLTQADLAEKINYSDKAVSKWERAESVPDLAVLKNIADLFETTIDELISEPKSEIKKTRFNRNLPKKRLIICFCAGVLVWLVAIAIYSLMGAIVPNLLPYAWLSFILALPITNVVLLVLTSVWGKTTTNMIITSILIWTTITAVYLCLINLLVNPGSTLWMIYLIGIPLQILIFLLFSYKKIK